MTPTIFINNLLVLIDEIYYIEKKVNPNGLKFRGRESQFVYRPGQEKKYTEADFID
jgi:hypothetical protein